MNLHKIVSPLLIIAFVVILRLLPHPPNAAPITALALFGGVYLNKRYALIVPFVAMLISDIFLGMHTTMPFVYGSFFITGLIGIWIKKHKNPTVLLGGTLMASVLFFIITNFGVWLVGGIYPHTFSGLIQCYYLALPFFRNTLLGDFLYVSVFFASFEIVMQLLRRRAVVHR